MLGRITAYAAALALVSAGALAWDLRDGELRFGPREPVAPRTPVPSGTASAASTMSPSPAPSPVDLAAPLAPRGEATADPTGAGIAAVVREALRDPALGARVAALVADETGRPLYENAADQLAVPASTAKLATGIAALQALDADTRFATRVVAASPPADGTVAGDVVLVGGGDPTLARTAAAAAYPRTASLRELARKVAAAGVRRVTGGIVADGSYFAAEELGPGWKPTYLSEGSVARVSGLMADGGRVQPGERPRYARPDVAAATAFRAELVRAGVRVGGAVVRGRAPADAVEVARVESPPVPALVERLVARSDNDLAEALGRHVAIAVGRSPTFAGSATAIRDVLGSLGAGDAVAGLQDASGLSPRSRLSPRGLVALLRLATDPERVRLRPVVSGLPVAGFSGTLATRYDRGAAVAGRGWVRAKTGSLDNVTTLAGFVVTRSGRMLLFAFAADRLPTRAVTPGARALDVAAAALARCGCSG